MIPTAWIQSIPPELLVCCLCGGRCEIRKCKCKANVHIYVSLLSQREEIIQYMCHQMMKVCW